jgi:hypothetical protein
MELAGKSAATSLDGAVTIIKASGATARDSEALSPLREAFYRGYIAAARGKLLADASAFLATYASKDKAVKAGRDALDVAAYDFAKTIWSRACDAAGLPKAEGQSGGRKANAGQGAMKETAPVEISAFVVPSDLSSDGAMKLIETMSRMVGQICSNAKVNKGNFGDTLRRLHNDLLEYANTDLPRALAKDAEDAKPAPKPSMAAKIESDDTKTLLAAMKAELAAAREREAKQGELLAKVLAKIA